MKEIRTEVRIQAPAQVVWAQLMDFEKYAEWNPFIISMQGEAKEGSFLESSLQLPGKKAMRFEPQVLVVDKNREFRWKGKLMVKGLFDGEHYFQLEEQADGTTKLTHGEIFTGLLSGVLYGMIGEETKMGFEAMNQALKGKLEGKREEVCHEA